MNEEKYYLSNKEGKKLARKVLIITLIVNIVLTALKTIFGAFFSNMSIISDAMHSLSDVGSTVLVLVAIVISKPQADKKHNYGHEKIESMAVLFFSLLLAVVAIMLVYQGVTGLINPLETDINFYLVAVTAFSIVTKEGMFWYTMHYAKKLKSNSLKADAWHHRSDSFSSVAVIVGLFSSIFLAKDWVENIAIIFVAILIMKVAIQILLTAINQLIDKAADETTCQYLKQLVLEVEGVKAIDKFQTRLFGDVIYVDVEIAVDAQMSLLNAHNIAELVHDNLENQERIVVKHCSVHVNPLFEDNSHDDCPLLMK